MRCDFRCAPCCSSDYFLSSSKTRTAAGQSTETGATIVNKKNCRQTTRTSPLSLVLSCQRDLFYFLPPEQTLVNHEPRSHPAVTQGRPASTPPSPRECWMRFARHYGTPSLFASPIGRGSVLRLSFPRLITGLTEETPGRTLPCLVFFHVQPTTTTPPTSSNP